jgi:hypothetical protein
MSSTTIPRRLKCSAFANFAVVGDVDGSDLPATARGGIRRGRRDDRAWRRLIGSM